MSTTWKRITQNMSQKKVFKDLNINKPYENILEAIDIIESEWKDLSENYEVRKKENKDKIPVYEKISRYINQTDIILEDRKAYTKSIFDVVNLFGSTTTSRDLFNEKALTELSEYNLGDLDLKQQGIDVVIVDEVSKSSFLEVLIPMLYGKSIILVGDHRQLPPMYEYRNFRKEDYEGLDENYIDFNKNTKFTKLYETSFFKSLFERLSDDYKVMLNKQYRSHEHIMNVFNHFITII